jgi:hypothetical protein
MAMIRDQFVRCNMDLIAGFRFLRRRRLAGRRERAEQQPCGYQYSPDGMSTPDFVPVACPQ